MSDSVGVVDDEIPGPSSAITKKTKPQKRKSKKAKVKVRVKRERRLSEEPDGLTDVDEEDDDDACATGPVGNNGNRHSVPMKLQLRLIETNVARLMKERDQITSIYHTFAEAEASMRKELDHINEMMKYTYNSAMEDKTPEQWMEFYQKHFIDKLYGSFWEAPTDDTATEDVDVRAQSEKLHATSHLDEFGELLPD